MKIRYDGPLIAVPVAGFGLHDKGKIKKYPRKFGEELLATSKRQKFVEVDKKKTEKKEKEDPKVDKTKTKNGEKGGADDGLQE